MHTVTVGFTLLEDNPPVHVWVFGVATALEAKLLDELLGSILDNCLVTIVDKVEAGITEVTPITSETDIRNLVRERLEQIGNRAEGTLSLTEAVGQVKG